MSDSYIKNKGKLIEQLLRFKLFVNEKDGQPGFISFRNSTGFLAREEDFKSPVVQEARNELAYNSWKKSWIGTGKIAACASRAINKSEKLVHHNQKTDFKNRLDPQNAKYRKDAEQALYDIYSNPFCDEQDAFKKAVEVFGGKYDTIAFLFFVKDDTRFLPIRSSYFDDSFKLLDIDYETSKKCGWDNYQGFIGIIKEIQTFMEDVLPMQGKPRLIDAHSFVWIIQEKPFVNWEPSIEQSVHIEKTTEEYIQSVISGPGGKRIVTSSTYIRNAEVVKETKKRANGICQLCKQPAPFTDKEGKPYLEVHHINWLSRGGKDSTTNTVALCPNCHARMHVLDRKEDVEKLKEAIADKT